MPADAASRLRSDRITLVLLPGLDGTGKLFAPFISELPSDLDARVVAYPTGKPLRLGEYADLVARALPGQRSVLLAESFSGLVALTLLMRIDNAVSGVIFCGGFAEPPRPFLTRLAPIIRHSGPVLRAAPAFMLRQFCLGADASSAQLSRLRAILAEVDPAVLTHRLQLAAARHPFAHTRFNTPCCYLQAENDRLVPSGAARWFATHFASFRLERIAGPHFLLQAQPAACAERVADAARSMCEHGREF